MIRTQISLSKLEYQKAKKEAQRLGISLAELFRRSLRSVLPSSKDKTWMKYSGLIDSGVSNASQNIDDIVYGHKD